MSHTEVIAKAGEAPVVHHMDTKTAYDSAKLGIWLFLATELLLFGVLFTAFAIFRWMYLEEFTYGAEKLNWKFGTLNTVILIFSSFTAALAVDAAQHSQNKKVYKYFFISIICAFMFLVVKYIEYYAKFDHGYFPFNIGYFASAVFVCLSFAIGAAYFGASKFCGYSRVKISIVSIVSAIVLGFIALKIFYVEGAHDVVFNTQEFNEQYKIFFGLYYCMTWLHALHVIIGLGLLTWVVLLAKKNRFSDKYYTPVEVSALYWHLVDLIWIYLFPLLYLVG